MLHFLGAVHQQGARVGFGRAHENACRPCHHGSERAIAAGRIAPTDKEARTHLAAARGPAHMVNEVTDIDWNISEARSRTYDSRLLGIVEARLGKAQSRGR